MLKVKKFFLKKMEERNASKLKYRSLEKNYDISKNVNQDVCKKCRGFCCKQCGCHFSPDDFKEITYEYLKKEMEKGYISVDYVEGRHLHRFSGIYILRIRNENAPVVDLESHGGRCILFDDEKGCPFSYCNRPTGGKLLIPEQETTKFIFKAKACIQKYPIQDCCYEWEPHQQVLKKLVKHFKYKYVRCSLKGGK